MSRFSTFIPTIESLLSEQEWTEMIKILDHEDVNKSTHSIVPYEYFIDKLRSFEYDFPLECKIIPRTFKTPKIKHFTLATLKLEKDNLGSIIKLYPKQEWLNVYNSKLLHHLKTKPRSR